MILGSIHYPTIQIHFGYHHQEFRLGNQILYMIAGALFLPVRSGSGGN